MLQPTKRRAYAQSGENVFTPVERELIFDIVSFSTSVFQVKSNTVDLFFLHVSVKCIL